MQCGILVALPLVHAARHNDVKPLLGRELMILTHDDDDDVCMYVCMYALAHDDGTSHFCVTSVSLMWTTPDGYLCMYVCMYG